MSFLNSKLASTLRKSKRDCPFHGSRFPAALRTSTLSTSEIMSNEGMVSSSPMFF